MVEKWLRDLATYPGILAGRRRDALGAVGNQRSRRMSRSEVHAATVPGANPPAMRTAGGMPYRHCRTSQTRTTLARIQ